MFLGGNLGEITLVSFQKHKEFHHVFDNQLGLFIPNCPKNIQLLTLINCKYALHAGGIIKGGQVCTL